MILTNTNLFTPSREATLVSRYELTNFTSKDSEKVFTYHIYVPNSENFYNMKNNSMELLAILLNARALNT